MALFPRLFGPVFTAPSAYLAYAGAGQDLQFMLLIAENREEAEQLIHLLGATGDQKREEKTAKSSCPRSQIADHSFELS